MIDDPRLQAAGASLLKALDAPACLACREGDRPDRGAGEAVRALTVDRQDGRYGEGVEADRTGVFAPIDPDGRLAMRRLRLAERAFLGLIRKWRKAGRLETAGRVIPPDTDVPQGGGVSPGSANVSGYEALDRWGETVVKPHGRGEAWRSRDADDLVCAFRFRREVEGFAQGLPKRRGKCTREVAAEKTRSRRCSRVHPGMTRRCTCLGVAWFWTDDRQGVPRVKRRPARKKPPRACQRIKAWMQAHRHLAGSSLLHRTPGSAPGTRSRLWGAGPLRRPLSRL